MVTRNTFLSVRHYVILAKINDKGSAPTFISAISVDAYATIKQLIRFYADVRAELT